MERTYYTPLFAPDGRKYTKEERQAANKAAYAAEREARAAKAEAAEMMTVEEIAKRLLAQGRRVAVAEADTCGLVGYLLSTVPGSSKYFPGGVIAYTGGLKQSILGVPDDLYNAKGSVSPEVASAMARGVRDLTGTDYGLSVTGVAGPAGGQPGVPIGTFYVAVAGPDGLDAAERIQADAADRNGNKRQAAQAVLDLLGRHLPAAG